MSLHHVMVICHMTRSGDSVNVRSSLATEVQLQREVKAAPRGAVEALGYSVLRSEQKNAIEKFCHDVFVFRQGRESMILPDCL